MSSTNPPPRRGRLAGHSIIAVAVLALAVVTAESARQSLTTPFDEGASAAGASDGGRLIPAALEPGPIPTPVPAIDNANALGSVEHPAGPSASGPALATVNADAPRTVAAGPALAATSPARGDTLDGAPSPTSAIGPTSPWPGPSGADPAPSPSVAAAGAPTPEPPPDETPQATPKPEKPHPTHPPHPHTPTPSPTATDPAEPEPSP